MSREKVGRGGTAIMVDTPGEKPKLTQEDHHFPTQSGKHGSVGLSVSAGMSTGFSTREKIEVSAWITLPCTEDPGDIQATYDVCYQWALSQVREKLDDATAQFFPPLPPKEGT